MIGWFLEFERGLVMEEVAQTLKDSENVFFISMKSNSFSEVLCKFQ